MEARYVALLILVPFVAVFAYATWHEYRRFRHEGRSTYGLTYDPETNTTHVDALPEHQDGFDPRHFNPEYEFSCEASDDPQTRANDTDEFTEDDKEQDGRT